MSLLPPICRTVPVLVMAFTSLSGCSLYYEAKVEKMVERQMDAMVFVEGGEFMMGNPGGWSVRSDTLPAHRVILDNFHIQKYEVTQGDFELFQAVTGYEHSNRYYESYRNEKPARYNSELPAVASWTDAMNFCQWLGEQSGELVTLPTEAQWEYAARAGGQMIRYATKNGKALGGVTMAAGPTSQNKDDLPHRTMLPKAPGEFPPNALGLYDMSGNASEWVQDYYQKDYYEKSPVSNPVGPAEGLKSNLSGDVYRVLRGGNYKDFIGNTTVTRRKEIQNGSGEISGFRCAMP